MATAKTHTKASPQGNNHERAEVATPSRDRRPSVDIGLESKAMSAEWDLLNRILANNAVLAVKTKNYHWNVTGLQFVSLHELFEKQYKLLTKLQDEEAERIRQLGGRPLGNMRSFVETATLREEERDNLDALSMVKSLLADHEECIKQLRDGIDECEDKHEDKGTADFLTMAIQEHELMAWMLRALAGEG